MNKDLDKLGDIWTVRTDLMVKDSGISIGLETRFDGNGNSTVRFIVLHPEGPTIFEKYDAAVGAFNYHVAKRKQPA